MRNLILAVGIMVLTGTNANAAILTFDDLALGDYGNTLNYNGVTFTTYLTSHLQVTDQTADGFGNAHSLPNKLSVWGEQPLTPIEKTRFDVNFNAPVEQVSFWLTGTFHDTTINAYSASGSLLETYIQTYPMDGALAPDGNAWDYYYDRQIRLIGLNASGISEISIQPSQYDGFSIDALGYNPVVTPEPATLVLFSIGGAGMLLRRFRQKNA